MPAQFEYEAVHNIDLDALLRETIPDALSRVEGSELVNVFHEPAGTPDETASQYVAIVKVPIQ